MTSASTPSDRPLLGIVRGAPTPEELAAVVAVLLARPGGAPARPPAPPSLWSRPLPRLPLPPGLAAWRAAALPS